MNNLLYNNKKVLLTNHFLVNFSGSELTTYNIACELMRLGAEVTVATFSYGLPISEIFEASNIKVINVLKEPLNQKEYDLIWSHHTPVLSNCIFENNVNSKHIIFSSLSPFEPLEAPPVYVNTLSICLSNSPETRDKLVVEGVDKDLISVFYNSVDVNFFNSFNKLKIPKLNNVCIISNHVPEEILELTDMLKQTNISYDIYGLHNKFEHITPEILKNYDAIITIGRSVQYGLSMGIPVYCYDRFGGPGWITKENYESAKYYNFSGRCTNRKISSIEIFNEITSCYEYSYNQRKELHEKSKEDFTLEKNVMNIIKILDYKSTDLKYIKKHYFMAKRINQYYVRELRVEENKDYLISNLSLELDTIHNSRGWKLLSAYYKFKYILLNRFHIQKPKKSLSKHG